MAPTKPRYHVSPERMIVLNSVDVTSKYRDNKVELFQQALDSSLYFLSKEIRLRSGIEAVPSYGLTRISKNELERDIFIRKIMSEQSFSDAIVITSFDVYFDQTDVEVTKGDDGSKSREAYYDIVSYIDYLWYDPNGLFKEQEVELRRFHSSRMVLSGLFAAGPNIVKQKDDAIRLIKDNLNDYLNYFLPGSVNRSRPIFVNKPFNNIKTMLSVNDFDRAMSECERFFWNPDQQVAAQAYYNYAVLLERVKRYDEVLPYLEKSQAAFDLPETYEMRRDY